MLQSPTKETESGSEPQKKQPEEKVLRNHSKTDKDMNQIRYPCTGRKTRSTENPAFGMNVSSKLGLLSLFLLSLFELHFRFLPHPPQYWTDTLTLSLAIFLLTIRIPSSCLLVVLVVVWNCGTSKFAPWVGQDRSVGPTMAGVFYERERERGKQHEWRRTKENMTDDHGRTKSKEELTMKRSWWRHCCRCSGPSVTFFRPCEGTSSG